LAANYWYLSPEWGLVRDFDYSWVPKPLSLVSPSNGYLLRSRLGEFLQGQSTDNWETVQADIINHRAYKVLDRIARNESPFFLFLNYMDAHWPYHSGQRPDIQYAALDQQAMRSEWEMRDRVDGAGAPIPAGYAKYVTSLYDGAIAWWIPKSAS
jgi:hypothetical protein